MDIKIAFYLDKENLKFQNYSNILDGNPGLGGTTYEFLLVSYLLDKRDNQIDVILLTRSNLNFPHKNVYYVKDLKDACQLCIANNIPLIVINQGQFNQETLTPYSKILSFILWAHNTMSYSKLSLISKLDYVKKIVCCGREMMDLYRDHIATLKSTYIYNIFPIKEKEWYLDKITSNRNNHNVVYMGCLAPQKGFHVLARAWKEVLKKVPDAQLYVIGNGQLYNQAKVGQYGLAEKNYEDLFMQYLKDDNGNLLPSVHFMGLMGIEKFDILAKCKIAVPNPTGITECLPITAIEMQLMGCEMVTIKHPAYIDTIYSTEYLFSKTSDLSNYIVKALVSNKTKPYEQIYQFIKENFGIEHNIKRWEYLIKNLDSTWLEDYSDKPYQMKKLKNILLHFKKQIPLFNFFPPIEKFYNLKNKISKYNQ